MASQVIEIEDSDRLTSALLQSNGPTAIKHHGDTVGVYHPVHRKWTDAERKVFREDTSRIQQMLEEAGVTEDQLVEDFRKLREAERR